MSIDSDIQSASPGAIVELFILDATEQGAGSIIYFVDGTISGATTVTHNGVTYNPLNVVITGMEFSAEGRLPTPTIAISNVSKTLQAEVIAYDDLRGAKLTRRRTFEKYLDGMPEADPTAIFADDIYYVDRKKTHNKYVIEWELMSVLDYEGKQLPCSVMLKDTCMLRYRIYDGGFDYTDSTCPYTGSGYFDAAGEITTSGNDVCGKRLSDCELRYPNDDDEIPFGGFPGIAKVRV